MSVRSYIVQFNKKSEVTFEKMIQDLTKKSAENGGPAFNGPQVIRLAMSELYQRLYGTDNLKGNIAEDMTIS